MTRQIEFETKVYIGYSVPQDGFTIKIEVETGAVLVCGSSFLERPDCSYSMTYDWKLEVSDYSDIFLDGNGLPQIWNHDQKRFYLKRQAKVDTGNVTVFVTVEGMAVNESNTFLLNTTIGDTTVHERGKQSMHDCSSFATLFIVTVST